MSWICSACGSENEDSSRKCASCGEARAGVITLTGSVRSFSFQDTVEIGRVIYKRMCGEDSKYVDTLQYTIQKTDDGWFLLGSKRSKQVTLVNGTAAEESAVELTDGAVIEIGSRTNDKRVAPVTVTLPTK